MKRLLGIYFVAFVALAGCKDDELTLAPGVSPWEASSVAPPGPECDRCDELGPVGFGHGDNRIMVDPDSDDAVAQWASCVQGVLRCVENGGKIPVCVESSGCPDACVNAYNDALNGSSDPSDFDNIWNAFELVFMQPTSVCGVESPADDVEVVP